MNFDKLIRRWHILYGEIASGNDNEDILQEMLKILYKLKRNNIISERTFNIKIQEINELIN